MEAFARIIKGFINQWYVNVFHLQLHQNRLKTFFVHLDGELANSF